MPYSLEPSHVLAAAAIVVVPSVARVLAA